MENKLFIRLDADNIGDGIELALLNENPTEAQSIHNKVQIGMQTLINMINSIEGNEILLVGSDDILFSSKESILHLKLIEDLRNEFYRTTMFTLSIGVGLTISSALTNLMRAKLSGKDKIVQEDK